MNIPFSIYFMWHRLLQNDYIPADSRGFAMMPFATNCSHCVVEGCTGPRGEGPREPQWAKTALVGLGAVAGPGGSPSPPPCGLGLRGWRGYKRGGDIHWREEREE